MEMKILEHVGTLSKRPNGWLREINLVSWNGGEPTIDIREWHPNHEKMSSGLTMPESESIKMAEMIFSYYIKRGQ